MSCGCETRLMDGGKRKQTRKQNRRKNKTRKNKTRS